MADKVEKKILDIKVNYNEAIKAIAEYQTKIDKAKEAEAKLKEQLKAGDIKKGSSTMKKWRHLKPISTTVMIRYVL